jgi:hypothetical protein
MSKMLPASAGAEQGIFEAINRFTILWERRARSDLRLLQCFGYLWEG